MTKRRGLGRGLGSLIPTSEEGSESQAAGAGEARGLRRVAVEQIQPNPRQPRVEMDPALLQELAESIQAHGLIQPLIVTAAEDGGYTLIAGERRWRAARLAGLKQVPVVLKEASSQEMLELALVENVQRADLNALEEALAYQQLMDEFGLTQEEVAKRVGKGRSTVANVVRLLKLPEEVQQAVVDGHLSGAHARALLALPTANDQRAMMQIVIERDYSVRQVEALAKVHDLGAPLSLQLAVADGDIRIEHAEALLPLPNVEAQLALVDTIRRNKLTVAEVEAIVEKLLSKEKPQPKIVSKPPPEFVALQDSFRETLGTPVDIKKGSKGGRVIIHFYSDEELQAIYEAIVGQ
ncbi:MAG: ParB/RepB/Spo0J family partition protein [Candidatus Promineifilaceae bacterium]|nr:ParB/RepB/Spo0J family partition protein [Candidatus Promineifilaceae bacterium]